MREPAVAPEVVGRERELGAISDLLTSGDAHLRGLVLEGEPGIGKSTVWRAGARQAQETGLLVLACRPVEAEAKFTFSALADLLAPIIDETIGGLPSPQRAALEVALLREPLEGAWAVSERALGMSVYSVLKAQCDKAPVLVAIDDLQWLDRGSEAALAFALRRLDGSTARLLTSLRLGHGHGYDILGLERALPGSVMRTRLGPLSLSGLYHVVRLHAGRSLARPALQRIATASGGNPLFALELARSLGDAHAWPGPGEPLPVPTTLSELLDQRVRQLPVPAREMLLAAACLSSPDLRLMEAALGRDVEGDLEQSARAGVARLVNGQVQFDHPLVASAVHRTATPAKRRSVHRALAAVVTEPEQHARHLALAAEGPDEMVASALEAAARAAVRRGAPEVGVELAQLACRLTPAASSASLAGRRLLWAEYVFRAGDGEEARRLATELYQTLPRGHTRARSAELLARVLHVAGTAPEAAACALGALADAEGDTELEAQLHATVALVSWHDFNLGHHHAQLALSLLGTLEGPDPEGLLRALMAYAQAEFYAGHELPAAAIERGLALERLAPAPSVADRLSAALGAWLKYQGDFEGARHWLDATYAAAMAEGDDSSMPYALSHLPQLELWAGNWPRAELVAHEHMELAEQMGQASQRRQALYNLSLVQAHRGQADHAREGALDLLRESRDAGDVWDESNAEAVLGFLELSLGRSREAAGHLGRGFELRESLGGREPLRSYGDYVEALIDIGDLERAQHMADLLSERASVAQRGPQLAVAAWSQGLVAAARRDLDGAVAALDEALGHHDRALVPFDRARSLLARGMVARRRGERKMAKASLDEARQVLGELGAPLWEARARAELARVPMRRGRSTDLTPTEESVATLAASGLTNREVAQALFMSPKTVEVNLARVYRKLAITSRAELGSTMAARNAMAEPKT